MDTNSKSLHAECDCSTMALSSWYSLLSVTVAWKYVVPFQVTVSSALGIWESTDRRRLKSNLFNNKYLSLYILTCPQTCGMEVCNFIDSASKALLSPEMTELLKFNFSHQSKHLSARFCWCSITTVRSSCLYASALLRVESCHRSRMPFLVQVGVHNQSSSSRAFFSTAKAWSRAFNQARSFSGCARKFSALEILRTVETQPGKLDCTLYWLFTSCKITAN